VNPRHMTEAEWIAAAGSLDARGVMVHDLSPNEVEVLFCAIVVLALRQGSTRQEVVRAVDAIIRANGHLIDPLPAVRES
jgi:hypothetical protein